MGRREDDGGWGGERMMEDGEEERMMEDGEERG